MEVKYITIATPHFSTSYSISIIIEWIYCRMTRNIYNTDPQSITPIIRLQWKYTIIIIQLSCLPFTANSHFTSFSFIFALLLNQLLLWIRKHVINFHWLHWMWIFQHYYNSYTLWIYTKYTCKAKKPNIQHSSLYCIPSIISDSSQHLIFIHWQWVVHLNYFIIYFIPTKFNLNIFLKLFWNVIWFFKSFFKFLCFFFWNFVYFLVVFFCNFCTIIIHNTFAQLSYYVMIRLMVCLYIELTIIDNATALFLFKYWLLLDGFYLTL